MIFLKSYRKLFSSPMQTSSMLGLQETQIHPWSYAVEILCKKVVQSAMVATLGGNASVATKGLAGQAP